MGQRRAMDSDIETFTQTERDMLRDRFADFERSVLQDNIILCDGKSGVLLAFDGAMVIFCVDTFVERQRAIHARWRCSSPRRWLSWCRATSA
jgi:hypothetical protein